MVEQGLEQVMSADDNSSPQQAVGGVVTLDEDLLRGALIEKGWLNTMDFARAQRVHNENTDESLVALLVRLGMVSERAMAQVQADIAELPLLKSDDYPQQAVETGLALRFMKDQLIIY